MKRTFFARYALLIICIVAFLGPFALRGARMSLERMTNRVKDWLPSDFAETRELEWFGRHFLGEQFVVLTWPGCSEEDPRYHELVRRLQHEVAPPEHPVSPAADSGAASVPAEEAARDARQEPDRQRARELGDTLGLGTVGQYYENWGERGEKWLRGDQEFWYFVTPQGELYRWDGRSNVLSWLHRTVQRSFLNNRTAEGELVGIFGQPGTAEYPNPFHADPRMLTARLFKSITTGPDTLRQLSRKQGPLWPRGEDEVRAAEEAHEKAVARLTGSLFGPDGKQTCIILTLSEPAKRDLRRVIGRELMGRPLGRLFQIASVECGISLEELKLGGPPVDNVAIDEEGQITLARLVLLSAVVGIGLSLFLVRSIRVTCMLFFIGGLTALSSLSIVWWTGGTVDAIMMSMPSLVYVLAMSGALHLVNYYREAVEEGDLAGAPGTMLRHGWKASVLCSVTTSLGLLSLYTSSLIPIRNFGLYSAVGVLSTLVLLFTFLPAALELWPPRRPAAGKSGQKHQGPSSFELGIQRLFEIVGGFMVRRYGWVTLGCTLVIGFCSLGLFRIQTSVHLIKFFDRHAEIIRDYTWLETHLAKLVPMEVVVRVRPELLRSVEPQVQAEDRAEGQTEDQAPGQAEDQTQSQAAAAAEARERLKLDFLERMEIAARIQREVERQLGEQGQGIVGKAMSAPTFAPDLPPPGYATLRNPIRSVMNRKLEEHRGEYLASDFLRVDREAPHAGSELWRISLRVGALRDIDYGQFVGEIKRVVEPVLTAYRLRHRILSELDARSQGEGFVKTRVAFLGVSDPAEGASPVADAARPPADQVPVKGEADAVAAGLHRRYANDAKVDQTRIFAGTLRDLMTCAGVYARADAWNNPDAPPPAGKQPMEQGFYTSQAWGDELASEFDCVVLVRDNPAYDLDFVKKHARIFIDARDHIFDPALPQSQTAAQRNALIHVVYTGVVPLVYKAQRSLLDSLIQSTFWSFVTITPLMMILARGWIAGIVVMLPNVLPVVVIFGGMGLMGIVVDVGSMMTASIALGVAVDDTIHFLTWFREDLDRLGDRKQAILAAYRRCALPTMQAAAISGLGLSVFALSTFTPTQRFGCLMLAILVAGVVAELIMLPALLAGPLGRFCVPRKPRRDRQAADSPSPAEQPSAGNDEASLAHPAVAGSPQPHIVGDHRPTGMSFPRQA